MFGLLCTPLVYFLGPLCSFILLYKICFLPINKKKKKLLFSVIDIVIFQESFNSLSFCYFKLHYYSYMFLDKFCIVVGMSS